MSNKFVNNKYLREKSQNILSEKGKIQKYKQYDTNFIMETHSFRKLMGYTVAR